jgi:hypothetical protein
MKARAEVIVARQQVASSTISAESVFHQARVLILIDTFSGRKYGLRADRLACLDFVLRHPYLLGRLTLAERVDWPDNLQTTAFERDASEAGLLRARYGSWTERYVLITGALVSRRLVTVTSTRPLVFMITPLGRRASKAIATDPVWRITAERARYLKKRANLSAERLDRAIKEALNMARGD